MGAISLPGVDADLYPTDPNNREAWLQERRKFIGGSEVAGIIGLSPWESPWSIWAYKKGLLSSDKEMTPNMRWGVKLEPVIKREFEETEGYEVTGTQYIALHRDNKVAGATLDGLVRKDSQSPVLGPLEMKSSEFRSPEDWAAEIPVYYQTQCQWQMYVTGTSHLWMAVFHGVSNPIGVYEMERDQSDIDYLVEEVEKFWTRYVLTGDSPPVDGHQATLDALAARYPEQVPEKEVELDGMEEIFADYNRAKETQKVAERAEKEAMAKIAERFADAEIGTLNGVPTYKYAQQSRRSVPVDALSKDHPEIAAQYMKTSKFRTLRDIKPPKEKSKK